MESFDYLKKQEDSMNSISEAVTIFEQMCSIPIDSEMDDLLFETGVYPDYHLIVGTADYETADNKIRLSMLADAPKNFCFSLVRQYQQNDSDDEFMQLRLDIYLKPELWNKFLVTSFWSDDDKSAFFQRVRNSVAYKHIDKHHFSVSNHSVSLDKT